jgi:glucose dehydrogenase
VRRPGITNDGLYLGTTLALRPTDGHLAWHFQHQANGQWDLDWAFERQIMQLPVKGRLETVVLTAVRCLRLTARRRPVGSPGEPIAGSCRLGLRRNFWAAATLTEFEIDD